MQRFFLLLLLLSGVIGWVSLPNEKLQNKTSTSKQLFLITTDNRQTQKSYRQSLSGVPNDKSKQIARIGDGYKTMASEFTTGSLLQQTTSTLIPSGSSYSISFYDDLSESDLKNQLGINVSGTVPIKEVVLTTAFNYAHNAAKTRLNRTTTLVAVQNLGTLKIQANPDQTYTVADSIGYYLDSNGQLSPEKIGSFYKTYGDSVVVSQDLVGKIFITAKLSFDSVAVSNEFNGSIGGSVASLFAGGGGKLIEINAKLKTLNENTKKHTTLTIMATQFGGTYGNLLSLFNSQATCSLDALNSCSLIIKNLNDYISKDFRIQLDPTDYNTWYAENIMVAAYDSLNFKTRDGLHVALMNNLHPLENIELTGLAIKVNQVIHNEIKNYNIASLMLESTDLSNDENIQARNVLNIAEQNYNKLKSFADYCYVDLTNCLQNNAYYVKSLVDNYQTNLLNPQLGKLLGRVQSKNIPLQGENERSSANFMNPQSLFASGLYSNIYFKVKTIDNDLITNKNVNFDVACDIRWTIDHFGFDANILTSVYPGVLVFNDVLRDNFQNLCGHDEAIYIRNPIGFSAPSLIIEMWGYG